jgi:hypothetical protein
MRFINQGVKNAGMSVRRLAEIIIIYFTSPAGTIKILPPG